MADLKFVVTATTVIAVAEPVGAQEIQAASAEVLEIEKSYADDDRTTVTSALVRAAMPSGRKVGEMTARQSEIFDLLADGLSNREVAAELGVSEHTVRVHMTAILRSLGVSNRTKAAVLAAAIRAGNQRAAAE